MVSLRGTGIGLCLDMSLLLLSVPCDPCPCPRPRISKWGSYYPPRYRRWKKEFPELLVRQTDLCGLVLPLRGPLEVRIEIHVTRPKTSKLDHPKPDIDNYIKAVLDGSNKILWEDDSQITFVSGSKQWGDPSQVVIGVTRVS
jgi:Holliday junction resolvase RusA-like endonuclease